MPLVFRVMEFARRTCLFIRCMTVTWSLLIQVLSIWQRLMLTLFYIATAPACVHPPFNHGKHMKRHLMRKSVV